MRIILLQDVPNVGLGGQVKEVKNGYARNYLIPRGLAAPATSDQLQRIKVIEQTAGAQRAREQTTWEELAKQLNGASLTIQARSGPEGRLFGSVTSTQIASALSRLASREVDRRGVLLPQAIREVGSTSVSVRLFPGVEVTVTVNVEAVQE